MQIFIAPKLRNGVACAIFPATWDLERFSKNNSELQDYINLNMSRDPKQNPSKLIYVSFMYRVGQRN